MTRWPSLRLSLGLSCLYVLLWGCGSSSEDSDPDAAPPPDVPDAATIDAGGGLDIAEACNPLGFEACLMPWPSAVYLRDADTTTGVQLDLPIEAMPTNGRGMTVSPAPFNRFDGFAPSGPMVVAFPDGVSGEGLPPSTDATASLDDDSPVVVVNMDSGERVPVFAEVDANAIFPEDRALIIRPFARLEPATRYAVAIRNTVKAADGGALPVPPGFGALLADTVADHPRMLRLVPRYDAIFAALQAQGIQRDELVLAWDFVTASDIFLTSDLVSMRAQALADMGPDGANLGFALEELDNTDPALVHRAIAGTYETPNFLSNGEEDDSVLRRDGYGLPALDGRYQANLSAIVPACVSEAPLPVPVVLLGHGLFGSGAGSLASAPVRQLAQGACVVIVASDFIGLSARQVALAAEVVTDLDLVGRMTEKLAQSVINFIALEQIVRGPLGSDPLFQVDGSSVLDPERVYYFGASLGGIMGSVFLAYDPVIDRGVLGVPGGAWSLLLERSYAWNTLQGLAMQSYENAHEYQLLTALMGMRFEPYDAITTAPRLLQDPLPNTPVKRLLMYQTIGDSLVTNLSTEMVARTMGIPVLAPSVRVPEGLQLQQGPLASGLAIYDEKPQPLPPTSNQPPSEDNGTHGGINGRPAVVRQVVQFLLTGQLVNECRTNDIISACDCSTGACD